MSRSTGVGVLAAVALVLAAASTATAQPIAGLAADIPTGAQAPRSTATARAAAAGVQYGNGPVMHSDRTHLIFWEPAGSGLAFDPGYISLIETFLSQVAADSHMPTNVYGLSGQYHDGNGPAAYNSQYAGALIDTDPLPPNGCTEPLLTGPGWTICLSEDQINAEMEQFIAAHHLPLAGPDLYILVTPNKMGNCQGTGPANCSLGGSHMGFCGYHTAIEGGALKYAVIPYNAVNGHCQSDNPRPNASTADPAISTISHEQMEAITDPFGDGWLQRNSSLEIGDLCLSNYGPSLGGSGPSLYDQVIHGGHYYLQEEWSNDDGRCAAQDESDRPSLSVQGRVRAGRKSKFVGHGSDPDGQIVAYFWTFGDGRTGSHRTVHHKYKRRGTYTLTLRVTDSDGNWAFTTRTIKVR